MSSLKFLSNCRYIASPYASVQDLSWRLLIRKLGVHLCFANVVKTFDNPIQDAASIRDDLFGISTVKREDRPLIVQVRDLHNLIAFKFEKYGGTVSLSKRWRVNRVFLSELPCAVLYPWTTQGLRQSRFVSM